MYVWCVLYSGAKSTISQTDTEFLCWSIEKYWERPVTVAYIQMSMAGAATGDLHHSKQVLFSVLWRFLVIHHHPYEKV